METPTFALSRRLRKRHQSSAILTLDMASQAAKPNPTKKVTMSPHRRDANHPRLFTGITGRLLRHKVPPTADFLYSGLSRSGLIRPPLDAS